MTAGDAQTALAGAPLATMLAVTVRDSKGMAVPNATVTFAATAGGGTVTPTSVVSNATGVAGGVSWTLGTRGGEQTVVASTLTFTKSFTATIQSTYALDLRFFGPTMSLEAQAAFTKAANRLRAVIISEVSSVPLTNLSLAEYCQVNGLTGTLNESTRGVIIYAAVAPIDGAGKVLAKAGPCAVRGTSRLPLLGVMQFDEADIQNYLTNGRFDAVVLHEMNHVLGFGTVWEDKGLLSAPAYSYSLPAFPDSAVATGSTNPRFTGASATANCALRGGQAVHCTTATGVAVEATGGEGTADGHWRESLFDSELMTGFIESTPNMPWSTMSIASFQDLGYTVNLLAADSYTVPSLLAMARMSLQAESASDGPREIVQRAHFAISDAGRITTIHREKK